MLVLHLFLPTQKYAIYRSGVSWVEIQHFLPTQKYAMYRRYHMTTCVITSNGEVDANLRNPKFYAFLGSLVNLETPS